jgi:hypothetical protein
LAGSGRTMRQSSQLWERGRAEGPDAFPDSSDNNVLTPVTLPPGRFMLVTRPLPTGSPPTMKTIGIGEARTCCASSSFTKKPTKTITPTLRRVRSVGPDRRSCRPLFPVCDTRV